MKGIFEFAQTLLDMIQTAYVALVLLGIFFVIMGFKMSYDAAQDNREAIIIGEALEGAKCLVASENSANIRGLFEKQKMDNLVGAIPTSCFTYPKRIDIFVRYTTSAGTQAYGFTAGSGATGTTTVDATLPVAVHMDNGISVPAQMKISVHQ